MIQKLQRVRPLDPVPGDIYNGDVLNREPDCKNLQNAMLTAETPCVLAVNAAWGAGKTVFMKMLWEECKAAEMPCVYFDAWKNDFHDDALAPMIGQIEIQTGTDPASSSALISAGRKACEKIPLLSTVAAALGLVGHMAADTAIGGAATVGGAAVKGVDNTLKQMGEKSDMVAEYVNRQKSMNQFREELEKFACTKKGKPLVFFVDELDRCRPIFAVEVLEKIKHVFDVPGVFFVIAVNKEELKKNLHAVYGDINATIYLRRFFDFEFLLENQDNIVMAALQRCQANADHLQESDALYQYLPLICQDFGLQPRDQEQAVALIARALSMPSNRHEFFAVFMAFFVALKFANPDLYQRCLTSARRDFANFPFADILDYYDSITGVLKSLQEENEDHPHRVPILSLCAMRFYNDRAYAAEVVRQSDIDKGHDRHTVWVDIRQLGSSINSCQFHGFVLTDNPRLILEKIELGAEKRR